MNLSAKIMIAALGLMLCQSSFAAEPAKKSVDKTRAYPNALLTKGMEACAEDIQKFCKDITPGQGRLGKCLHAHLANLSPSCLQFATHGGAGHEQESLVDIDRYYSVKTSSRPASGKK